MNANSHAQNGSRPRENAKIHKGRTAAPECRSEVRFFPLKPLCCFCLCALCVGLWQTTLAGVRYVDVNSTNATPPYTNWAIAARDIQAAVDAAVAGDEILVTNGNYVTGGGWRGGDAANAVGWTNR